jgi:hypothetical protein
VGSPRPFPPTIKDRAAVVERAIRNEFPDVPCQIARGFHQAFLNHFALFSSEMRVDPNSKKQILARLFKGV